MAQPAEAVLQAGSSCCSQPFLSYGSSTPEVSVSVYVPQAPQGVPSPENRVGAYIAVTIFISFYDIGFATRFFWPMQRVAFFIFGSACVFVFTGMANSLAFGLSKVDRQRHGAWPQSVSLMLAIKKIDFTSALATVHNIKP
jgi:hypothetical protein